MKIKNLFLSFLLTVITATLVSACRERTINGDLDSQWQITNILYSDGTETAPHNPEYYFCIYRHTIQLKYTGMQFPVTGNMAYDEKNASMTVEIPDGWNSTLAACGFDKPADTGAKPYTSTLHIETLDSKHLTLVTPGNTVIHLRKY